MDADQFQQFLQALQGLNVQGQGAGAAPGAPPVITNTGIRLRDFEAGGASEWRDYRAHFVMVSEISGWDGATQRLQLKAAMRGAAAATVRDLSPNDYQDIDAMLTAFENRFIPAAESLLAQTDFQNARQQMGESIQDWHSRLRTLFIRAHPARNAHNDVQLIQVFALGIIDSIVRAFTLRTNAADFQAALTAAQNEEAVQSTTKRIDSQRSGQGVNMVVEGSGEEAGAEGVHALGRKGGDARKEAACFFCNKPGHFQKDCHQLDKARKLIQSQSGSNGKNSGGRGAWKGKKNKKKGVNALEKGDQEGPGEEEQGN